MISPTKTKLTEVASVEIGVVTVGVSAFGEGLAVEVICNAGEGPTMDAYSDSDGVFSTGKEMVVKAGFDLPHAHSHIIKPKIKKPHFLKTFIIFHFG